MKKAIRCPGHEATVRAAMTPEDPDQRCRPQWSVALGSMYLALGLWDCTSILVQRVDTHRWPHMLDPRTWAYRDDVAFMLFWWASVVAAISLCAGGVATLTCWASATGWARRVALLCAARTAFGGVAYLAFEIPKPLWQYSVIWAQLPELIVVVATVFVVNDSVALTRRVRSQCVRCGYRLHEGCGDRCPECGEDISPRGSAR